MTTDKQVADSLTAQGKGMSDNDAPPQTIIPTLVTCGPNYRDTLSFASPIIPPAVTGGAEGVIRSPHPSDDGPSSSPGPWAKGWEDRVGVTKKLEEAGIIPPTEGLVERILHLKLKYTDSQILGVRNVTITPQDLFDFQRDYTARQEINVDGSHTIIVTKKEG